MQNLETESYGNKFLKSNLHNKENSPFSSQIGTLLKIKESSRSKTIVCIQHLLLGLSVN